MTLQCLAKNMPLFIPWSFLKLEIQNMYKNIAELVKLISEILEHLKLS